MKKSTLLIGYCCLFLNSFSFADEYTNSLLELSWDELIQIEVNIATGSRQTIDKAPATVTVITAEDIKNTGATNLTDILESVPGIHINSNFFGNRPLVHIRGTSSFQTLLMLNGNDTRDLIWAFGIFWKGIPVSAIERIEIIRGPGSALYGADASAGVINVITKTAGKITDTEAGLRIGSFKTKTAFVQSGGELNGHDLALTAEFSTTDGHDPFIKADIYEAAGKAQYGWDNQDIRFSISRDNWQFLANYIKHDNLETGISGARFFDPISNTDDKRIDLDLLYNNQNFSKNWGIDAKLHYQDLDYSSNNGFQEAPPGTIIQLGSNIAPGTYTDGLINHIQSAERQISFETSGLYSGINNHSIRIGAGYNWQDLYRVEQQVNFGRGPDGTILPVDGPLVDLTDTPYAFAPEQTRKISHLFIQDVWDFADNWALTAGARYDHYSDFGNTINPRLALIWKSTKKLTTKLMYGQAFRVPSFQELYAVTLISMPNSDLKPEKSEAFELAFSYASTENLLLGMNLFNFEITDFISRDETTQFQNTGRHKILGVEIEARWQATKELRLSGNYSFRNPDNNKFRQVTEAEQEAYFRSDWNFKAGWNWNLQASWIAERNRADNDPRSDLDDYIITDTTLRYTGLKQWEFATSVRNLFNEDAREHTGKSITDDLPLAERNFYAEVRYKF